MAYLRQRRALLARALAESKLSADQAQLAAAIFSERAPEAGARFAAEDIERLFSPLDV